MKKEIKEEIEIPEGIEVNIEGSLLKFKKENMEIDREFTGFSIKKEGNKLVLHHKKATKREKKLIMTTLAHIKNMIEGLNEGHTYKLEICAVHFPITASYDKTKKEFIIKNFLGESKPRTIKLPEKVDVEIDKNIITLSSYDIEAAGLAVSMIERISKVKNKDRRVFQDGIFLIEKPGRKQ